MSKQVNAEELLSKLSQSQAAYDSLKNEFDAFKEGSNNEIVALKQTIEAKNTELSAKNTNEDEVEELQSKVNSLESVNQKLVAENESMKIDNPLKASILGKKFHSNDEASKQLSETYLSVFKNNHDFKFEGDVLTCKSKSSDEDYKNASNEFASYMSAFEVSQPKGGFGKLPAKEFENNEIDHTWASSTDPNKRKAYQERKTQVWNTHLETNPHLAMYGKEYKALMIEQGLEEAK